jgi:hypothetical protein
MVVLCFQNRGVRGSFCREFRRRPPKIANGKLRDLARRSAVLPEWLPRSGTEIHRTPVKKNGAQ